MLLPRADTSVYYDTSVMAGAIKSRFDKAIHSSKEREIMNNNGIVYLFS
jgi:hypothetical protein